VGQIQGTIFDIRKFSVHDGPGIRTTVFLKGCPLSCAWCHNPESQSFQPEIMYWEQRCVHCGKCIAICTTGAIVAEEVEGNIRFLYNRNRCTNCGDCVACCPAEARTQVGRLATVDSIIEEIERDRIFYDESGGGVTFSGGEPLLQVNFLKAMLEECRQIDLHTAVDTSGYVPWKSFESILPFTDLFLYDIKIMDGELHRRFTGASNSLILSNLEALSHRNVPIILRVPVIPGINDGEENLLPLARLAGSLPNLSRVDLLPYHPSALGKYDRLDLNYSLHATRTPTTEHMQEIARFLEPYHLNVHIGG